MSNLKPKSSVTFRPRGKTAERLAYAEQVKLNISEVINECLEKHLQSYLKKKVEKRVSEIQQLTAVPMP